MKGERAESNVYGNGLSGSDLMKRLIVNLTLLVGSTILCLVIGELTIRIALPQQLIVNQSPTYRSDRLLGYRQDSNLNSTINLGEGLVHVITDRNGYRINQPAFQDPTPRDSADYSVLTLGDSFLQGFQVESRQTIPQVLKRRLERDWDVKVHAVNGGVAGWDLNHYYLEAKRLLESESYDLGIIFVFIGNDLTGTLVEAFGPAVIAEHMHRFHLPTVWSWSGLIDALFYPINDFLERRSHLFLLFRIRSQFILSRLNLTAAYFPEIFLKEDRLSNRWEIAGDIFERTKTEFDNHETPLLLVLLPTSYQVHGDIFDAYVRNLRIPRDSVDLDQPNRILRLKLAELGADYIDMLEPMRRSAAIGSTFFGRIDPHMNASGHRKAAETIQPGVELLLGLNREGMTEP